MISVEITDTLKATIGNNNQCSGDAGLCEFVGVIIQSFGPSDGDPHMAAANYFKTHPELHINVINASFMREYNDNVIY
jgi:hypothetical protein